MKFSYAEGKQILDLGCIRWMRIADALALTWRRIAPRDAFVAFSRLPRGRTLWPRSTRAATLWANIILKVARRAAGHYRFRSWIAFTSWKKLSRRKINGSRTKKRSKLAADGYRASFEESTLVPVFEASQRIEDKQNGQAERVSFNHNLRSVRSYLMQRRLTNVIWELQSSTIQRWKVYWISGAFVR